MPLYSLVKMRNQQEKNRKKKKRISDLDRTASDLITINHDGIHIETTLDETIFWDKINMKIVGTMNCGNNPPFPKAHGGDTYIISESGTFGTYDVEKGDMVTALSDVEESRDEKFEKLWFHFSKSGGGGSVANIPVATNTTIGGILAGEDIIISSDGHVTIVDDSHNHSINTITGLTEVLSGKASAVHTHQTSDITDFNDVLNSELDTFSESFKQPMTGATSSNPGTVGMVPRPLAGDQLKFLRGDGSWAYPDNDTTLADLGVDASAAELSYSKGLTGNIQTQINNVNTLLDTKANASHTHNYAASSTPGGSATTAEKVVHPLQIRLNGGEAASFDGSEFKEIDVTPDKIGAAPTSHGNHVPNYSSSNNNQVLMVVDGQLAWGSGGTSEDDPVQYSVFTGTDGSGDGSIGLVPAPKSADAGKFLGASGKWEKPISSLSDLGIQASVEELNYVKGVTSSIQTQLNGKAATSHTHNYAASTTVGGNAITADKVAHSLGIKVGTDGTSISFDGSNDQNITITPSAIGAANLNHGNHVKDFSEENNGQVYKVVNGEPVWADETGSNLVGSATKDHILVFNDSEGAYKDSGKTISDSMGSIPSPNILLTEAGIAAYVESILDQFNKKSTVTISSYSITSGGSLNPFLEPVILKKISIKILTDVTATGFTISRGDWNYTVTESNMITGKTFEYPVFENLDGSVEPLQFTFNDYQAGSIALYLEYAYDINRDLDTGESNLYLVSKNLYNNAMSLHTFATNGFVRSITINPMEDYNDGTTLTVKAGSYSMYSKEISLKKNTSVTIDFYYQVQVSADATTDLTIEIGNYTNGSSKVYLEYADELTATTVENAIMNSISQLDADSERLNTVLDGMST